MYLYFENKRQSCRAQRVNEGCSLHTAMEQMTSQYSCRSKGQKSVLFLIGTSGRRHENCGNVSIVNTRWKNI